MRMGRWENTEKKVKNQPGSPVPLALNKGKNINRFRVNDKSVH